jgi:hypothetical protein
VDSGRTSEPFGKLIVGGARLIDRRCIFPIIRFSATRQNGFGIVHASPIALLIVEEGEEYIALLPGAGTADEVREAIDSLREDIERERRNCEV